MTITLNNEKNTSDYRGRWYVVGILCMLYALSMIDRFVLAVIASPVSESLGMSNTQMGLLLGAGFALLYSLVGMPIAQWIDSGTRKYILVAGVVLWSLTTIASAFAHDFTTMLACRSGVAIGEAVLTPAAISLITDMFKREEQSLPTSIYMATSSIMATGAFIVGGAALDLSEQFTQTVSLEPWRMVFLMVGFPGLIIAAVILFTVREPARTREGDISDHAETNAGLTGFITHISDNLLSYFSFLLGIGAISILTFALLSWAPSIIGEALSWEPAQASYLFGIVGVPASFAGTLLWPWLAKHMLNRGHEGAQLWMIVICMMIAGLSVPLITNFNTPAIVAVGIGLCMFCLPTISVLCLLTLQRFGPNRMIARLSALGLLTINLFGYSVGPWLIAVIGENKDGGASGLISGLERVCMIVVPIAILCIFCARVQFLTKWNAKTQDDAKEVKT